MMNVLPCFVELGPQSGHSRPSARLRSVHWHHRREPEQLTNAKGSAVTGAALAVSLSSGIIRRASGRSRRALKTVRALPTIADIPAEVDGDSCTPPWKSSGAAEIPEEVLEHLERGGGQADYVLNMEEKNVRGCMKGAKQVATLGPASASDEMLERLFLCGVDTFRLNFSHGDHEEKTELIKRIRAVETKYRHPIGILADMQGPKLLGEKHFQSRVAEIVRCEKRPCTWILSLRVLRQRCGKFEDPNGVELIKGQMPLGDP